MTLKQEILQLVKAILGLTDREITDRLRGRVEPQQPITRRTTTTNKQCLPRLGTSGSLSSEKGSSFRQFDW